MSLLNCRLAFWLILHFHLQSFAGEITGVTTPIGSPIPARGVGTPAAGGGAEAENMVQIPAGSFQMGDSFRDNIPFRELPVHAVFVSDFFIDKYEVTKARWDEVRIWAVAHGYDFDNVGLGKETNHPVVRLNWYDAVKWCNARSEKEGRIPAYYTDEGLTRTYTKGQSRPFVKWETGYRLPTEAEWEKAARGGVAGHRFAWSDTDVITQERSSYTARLDDPVKAYDAETHAGLNPLYANGSSPYTSPVGSFAPNGYGLYDMTGNTFEWCWDRFSEPYPTSPQSDPTGPATGELRVLRGGSWNASAFGCRISFRLAVGETFQETLSGFRTVLPGAPKFRLAASTVHVNETAGTLKLIVRKTSGPAASVKFETVVDPGTDTAKAGRDYAFVPPTQIDFPAGDFEKEVLVTVFDNFVADGERSFRVRITDPDHGLKLSDPAEAEVIIDNDDAGTIGSSSSPESRPPDNRRGAVKINIVDPPQGGRWRLEWEPRWHASGEIVSNLPPDRYTIVFQPLTRAGYATPPPLEATVLADIVNSYSYGYPPGSQAVSGLTVQLRGLEGSEYRPVTVPPDAKWRLDGIGEPLGSGATLPEVIAGTHLVEFLDTPGWTTPETLPVTIIPGQGALITGVYVRQDCPPPGVRKPEALTLADIEFADETQATFQMNGQIKSAAGRGSGVAVRDRVVLTAANVVFDSQSLVFTDDVRWHRARMRPESEPPALRARGIQVLAGYAEKRSAELTNGAPASAGEMDVAALWFLVSAARGGYSGFLSSQQVPSEWLDPLHDTTLVGYPVEGGIACPVQPGVLHELRPAKYEYLPLAAQVVKTAGYLSFHGNNGGAVYARLGSGDRRMFPAGIYLGPGQDRISRIRVIDTNVVTLVNLAASFAGGGTNFTSGGVISLLRATNAGANSLQRLIVNLSPPTATWRVLELPKVPATNSGASFTLPASQTVRVIFSDVPGYLTPTNFPVSMQVGQDAILNVSYGFVPPVLAISSGAGLQIQSGPAGLKVRLQHRTTLGTGEWSDVANKQFTLGSTPVTALTHAEGQARPGFYRVVVAP